MFVGLVRFGALLALAFSVASESRTRVSLGQPTTSPPLEARFIGQMAVAVTDGATTIITDFPYQAGYGGAMTYGASEIRSSGPPTLALITHHHADHWSAPLFLATGWKILGPPDVVAGIPADRIVPLSTRASFGAATIEPVKTPHARIPHYSYVVTWRGKRLLFTGDTERFDALVKIPNLDVAFVSPWLFQSIVRSGQRIDTKQVVIYHHEAGARIAECMKACTVPAQGATIAIER